MKYDPIKFTTEKSLQEIRATLQNVCTQINAETERIESKDVFGVEKYKLEIGVLAHGRTAFPMGVPWGVQICVYDKGTERLVELSALDNGFSSSFAKAYFGANNGIKDGTAYKMSTSKTMRDKMYNALHW